MGRMDCQNFNRGLLNSNGTQRACYSIIDEATPDLESPSRETPTSSQAPTAEFHRVVNKWLQRLCQETGWTENTSLGDLTRFVQSDLLVVDLLSLKLLRLGGSTEEHSDLIKLPQPPINLTSPRIRADATTLLEKLRHINSLSLLDESYILPTRHEGLQLGKR